MWNEKPAPPMKFEHVLRSRDQADPYPLIDSYIPNGVQAARERVKAILAYGADIVPPKRGVGG